MRRRFLHSLVAAGGLCLVGRVGATPTVSQHLRPVPSTGEWLPAIGMGTWITFNVGNEAKGRAALLPVLQAFFDHGGRVIDSSPMYGSSEEVLGDLLGRADGAQSLFAATKVWTPGRWLGEKQMERSQALWGVERFDLMQIHNLLSWETHVETLKRMKDEGRIRYMGITTSHGRRHEEFATAMRREPFDFVQFTYNIAHREAEERLSPLAAERGIAVIANRPFDGGALFEHVRGRPLPDFAAELGCRTWAEYFLKFVISHPAVTCAIPATSRVDHMHENMGALVGPLPDPAHRARMAAYFDSL